MSDLQKIKDDLSREATGITTREAIERGICAQCRNVPEFYSSGGRREYPISGLCEFCFDKACDPEVCKNCSTPLSWHQHGKTSCTSFDPVDLGGPEDGTSDE